MPKHGQAAIKAVELVVDKEHGPVAAWNVAVAEVFKHSVTSQRKGCPRGAFLGLAEEGVISGVPEGDYTKSEKNKGWRWRYLKSIQSLQMSQSSFGSV